MTSISLAAALPAPGASPAAEKEGIESTASMWSIAEDEKNEALKLKGNVVRGKDAYEICEPCHLPSGAGRPNGQFPQLAGQHATVLIKQLADIRAGLRDNPKMYSFAIQLSDPRDLADVAAYIESLCVPIDHGKYEGADAARQIADGKALYETECRDCHGANGEGIKDKFYPAIAGQHYPYLLRQMSEIRAGKRRNANREMVGIIRKYNDQQLVAIAAYQASLSMPGKACKAHAPGKAAAKKKS